ncbi:MAG: sugar phosphate nucleotidyltransferase [Gammaproteobacteria bacterium]|nr:sugar phosphate nucleotidyltransferase [Gammaproteobacteria bacterium]MDE0362643.1 sugar phosphate nucleotidyltransferase [Rhodospirillaceae bacterium]
MSAAACGRCPERLPQTVHALFGEGSLLQGTALRAKTATRRPPIVVCDVHNRFLAAEQLRAVGLDWRHIALEPEARNTAPATALAAHPAVRDDEEAHLLVLPADHVIDDDAKIVRAVETATAANWRPASRTPNSAPVSPAVESRSTTKTDRTPGVARFLHATAIRSRTTADSVGPGPCAGL